MTIIPITFSKKKAAMSTERVISKVAVIFNLVNHASLIAAVLYTLVRREFDEATIVLIDVRDRLPMDMDEYVWVDAGGPDLYRQYLQANSNQVLTLSNDKAWLADLESKSICIGPVDSPQNLSLDTTIGRALASFPGEIKTSPLKVKYHGLFTQFAVLSQNFNKDQIAIDDYCAYYAALDLAYSFYHGELIYLSDFIALSTRPSTSEDEFKENQRRMAKSVMYKSRETNIEGYSAQLVTTMGPDVYNLIRRIGLAKKACVHVSAGCYGQVIYTEDLELTEKAGFGKTAFLLIPKPLTVLPTKPILPEKQIDVLELDNLVALQKQA